jgi:predicted RNase H-like nuclease (RuvC/YqgF family)
MLNWLTKLWTKPKRSPGPTAAGLQKELDQYIKDRDAKSSKLRNSIQSLEKEVEKLQSKCDQAKELELVKTQRILEAKLNRLEKIKIELKDFESSIESNLQYLKDHVMRLRDYELNLDANAVLFQSEEALKNFKMRKEVIQAIEEDQKESDVS